MGHLGAAPQRPQGAGSILYQAGSESNRSRQTYFGVRDSDCPGPLSQITAFSPRFPLFLLFYKVVDCNAALLCVDGQDLPPVADDHKIQVRIGGR
jgi:hypothetical protein